MKTLKTLKEVHDENLHRRFDLNDQYPDPDIPLEQAWNKMNELLDKTPVSFSVKKTVNASFRNYFIITASSLVVILMAVLIYISKKPKQGDSISLIHKTSMIPVKEKLTNGVVAFIDRNSSLKEITDKEHEPVVEVNGAAYFEGTYGNVETIKLKAGELVVQGWRGSVYVAFESDSSISTVQVQSGSAEVVAGSTNLNVKAGESVRYFTEKNHIEYLQTADPNPSSYATRVFDFADMPLKKATEYLEKAYGVTFVFQNTNLYDCRITTRFDNKTLEEIMDVMSYTLGFEYKIDAKNNIVYISGKGCV